MWERRASGATLKSSSTTCTESWQEAAEIKAEDRQRIIIYLVNPLWGGHINLPSFGSTRTSEWLAIPPNQSAFGGGRRGEIQVEGSLRRRSPSPPFHVPT